MQNKISLIILSVFFVALPFAYADNHKVIGGVIDIHSTLSDGLYTPEKIAGLAKGHSIAVLIFGDSCLTEWEYGLWPFRNLFKKTVRQNSVLRWGAYKYLDRLSELNKKRADLLVIPGAEVSPFYYWKGNPLSKDFSLNDYYKQFLIFGLNADDYRNLPILGVHRFFYFSKKTLLNLWPLAFVIFGIVLFVRRKNQSRASAVFFILLGIVFFMNNFPCHLSNFSPYQGRQGIKPYQEVIDYVKQKGGFIFWAHPEMGSIQRYKGIAVSSPAHPENLLLAKDYDGFGVTFSDLVNTTEAGNVWDKVLLEYAEGRRGKPAWIIASLHYDGPNRAINAVETDFFLKNLNQEDLFQAIREGRMYVRFNPNGKTNIILEEFSAKLISPGSAQITIKGKQSNPLEPAKFEIIRNGKIFKTFEQSENDFTIIQPDTFAAGESPAYYRLKISGSGSLILSNPVFVKNEGK